MAIIYRYISFESFVDILLSKKLTLVHPSLFDDPYENMVNFYKTAPISYVELAYNNMESEMNKHYLKIQNNLVYTQSWSRASESDAMWRIYSFNKRSICLAVDENKLKSLENVKLIDIIYNEGIPIPKVADAISDISCLYTYKRLAFNHEEEARLFYMKKLQATKEKVFDDLIDYDMLPGHDQDGRLLEQTVIRYESIEDKYNLKLKKNTHKIRIDSLDDFIDEVTVNPFAPDWYVSVVEKLCKNYNINFFGKSMLYEKI